MTQFKGTPGPWRATKDGTEVSASTFPILEGSKQICIVNQSAMFDYSGRTAKANAVLISKAPEMCACIDDLLKELAFHGYTHSTAINNAKELLKEATEVPDEQTR